MTDDVTADPQDRWDVLRRRVDVDRLLRVLDGASLDDIEQALDKAERDGRDIMPPPVEGDFYGFAETFTDDERRHQKLLREFFTRDVQQKRRWLPAMYAFDKIGSWALTEPLHGSDAAGGLDTTATRAGDTWTLNGEKKWSGNATIADVNVVWAKDTSDGQVKGFLVERGTPGYEVRKLHGKIGKRAVDNVDIALRGVEVDESATSRNACRGRARFGTSPTSWREAGPRCSP